jgi:hypothetical protein
VTPGSSTAVVSGEVDCPRDLMTSPYMDLMADFWAGVMDGWELTSSHSLSIISSRPF